MSDAWEVDADTAQRWAEEALHSLPSAESWMKLMLDLRGCAGWYRHEEKNSPQENKLQYPNYAFQKIINFLSQQPHFLEKPNDLEPLMLLHAALVDLSRGRVAPLLAPPKKAGNPGEGMAYEISKALAARAMSELMEGGVSTKEAARRVVSKLGNFYGKGRVPASRLTNWRARLEQGPGDGLASDGPALFAYRQKLPLDYGNTPIERAMRIIEDLMTRPG